MLQVVAKKIPQQLLCADVRFIDDLVEV